MNVELWTMPRTAGPVPGDLIRRGWGTQFAAVFAAFLDEQKGDNPLCTPQGGAAMQTPVPVQGQEGDDSLFAAARTGDTLPRNPAGGHTPVQGVASSAAPETEIVRPEPGTPVPEKPAPQAQAQRPQKPVQTTVQTTVQLQTQAQAETPLHGQAGAQAETQAPARVQTQPPVPERTPAPAARSPEPLQAPGETRAQPGAQAQAQPQTQVQAQVQVQKGDSPLFARVSPEAAETVMARPELGTPVPEKPATQAQAQRQKPVQTPVQLQTQARAQTPLYGQAGAPPETQAQTRVQPQPPVPERTPAPAMRNPEPLQAPGEIRAQPGVQAQAQPQTQLPAPPQDQAQTQIQAQTQTQTQTQTRVQNGDSPLLAADRTAGTLLRNPAGAHTSVQGAVLAKDGEMTAMKPDAGTPVAEKTSPRPVVAVVTKAEMPVTPPSGGEARETAAAVEPRSPAPLQAQAVQEPIARQVVHRVLAELEQMRGQVGKVVRLELQLNPPELGKVVVRLIWQTGGLEARFLTGDQTVRGAIEQALPQLREALGRQEVNLLDVSADLARENDGQPMRREPRGGWLTTNLQTMEEPENAVPQPGKNPVWVINRLA